MADQKNKHYSTRETADILGFSMSFVRRIAKNLLKAEKVGCDWVFTLKNIQKFDQTYKRRNRGIKKENVNGESALGT